MPPVIPMAAVPLHSQTVTHRNPNLGSDEHDAIDIKDQIALRRIGCIAQAESDSPRLDLRRSMDGNGFSPITAQPVRPD